MSDVFQRALDACVAPGGILLRYPNDEPLDFHQDAATSQSCGVRPFPRDQLPVPSENRVGRDDRRDLTEPATAYPVSLHGQPTALVIGEADPATEARGEDAVFLNQIRDARLPLVGPPAGHGHHEKPNRGDIHDRRSLH